jgi:hypothetical protein
MSWLTRSTEGPGRARPKPPLKALDAAFVGCWSALTATGLIAPIIASGPLSSAFGVRREAIVAIAVVGRLALAVALARLTVRGGMVGARVVVALAALAATGLALVALVPASVPLFPLVMLGIAAVGAGGAVGYLIQANILAQVDEPSIAAAQAHGWELVFRSVLLPATGCVVWVAGWRWAFLGLAGAMCAFAALQLAWRAATLGAPDRPLLGLPREQRVSRARIGTVFHQSPGVSRRVSSMARLYAVWELFYALPALMGADPLLAAALASVPPLLAAFPIRALGRVAEARPGRVVRGGTGLAIVGLLLLAAPGSGGGWPGWSVAFLAVCIGEVGMNAGPPDLKGNLVRRGFDPVRQQLTAMLSRFLWSTGTGMLLALGWWWLQPLSPTKRAVVFALSGAVVLLRVASDVAPRLLTQAEVQTEKQVHKVDDARFRIDLIALPPLPGAVERWFCVGIGGRWRKFEVTPGGALGCRSPGRWLWELEPSVFLGTDAPALAPGAPSVNVPPEPLFGVGRGLPIEAGRGVTGTLRRLIDEPITASAGESLALAELPAALRGQLGDAGEPALASHVAGNVNPNGRARAYTLESPAFVGTIYVVSILDQFAGAGRSAASRERPHDAPQEHRDEPPAQSRGRRRARRPRRRPSAAS